MKVATLDDPTPTRASATQLPAWIAERFPPDQWVMFFVIYATAMLVGRFAASTQGIPIRPGDLAGAAAAWCFFLMLRVFDEHKDYEIDLANHPNRVLQSGRISLEHLKVLGGLAIAFQAGASLWLDGGLGRISFSWAVMFGWSLLMAKEFFAGAWLEKRLVLYALSHMLVMPMALVWMAQTGAGSAPLPTSIGLLAAVSFFTGAAFEVTRKSKGADEERDSIQSYSRIFGTRGAAAVVFCLLAASTALLLLLVREVLGAAAGAAWYLALAALLALPAFGLFRYSRRPSARARRLDEALVGVALLGSHAILIAAVVVARGLTWS